jgi:diguanylate cyclase (GGDEF)-like protein
LSCISEFVGIATRWSILSEINSLITQDQLLSILHALPNRSYVATRSGRIVAIFGGENGSYYYEKGLLLGRLVHDTMPKEKAGWFVENIQRTLKDQSPSVVQYRADRDDVIDTEEVGEDGAMWFEGHIQPLPDLFEGEPAVLWVVGNITRRHYLETRLRHQSDTDDLTGLYNRRKLMNEMAVLFESFQRYKNPTSLFIFDIDSFKEINDAGGHQAGDEAIKAVADVCKRESRKTDLVARLGGDEFVILMPNTQPEEALQLAERLRAVIEQTWAMRNCGTISGGVSDMRMSDGSVDDILRRADVALYEAKSQGRNRVRLL